MVGHNVNVPVVRRERPSVLPKCPDHENAVDSNSLASAGKFNQFEPASRQAKARACA